MFIDISAPYWFVVIGVFELEFSTFKEETSSWIEFATDKIFGKKQKISPEMFEKATKAKCFLGLVDLKVLIEKCIEC